MIEIDGSQGEGGGQVLRTALALALATGKGFRIRNIRARRPKPGLRPQHLKAVQAAGFVGNAEVEGAHLGSGSVLFRSRAINAKRLHLDIGTAGATALVFQTIFVPLSMASATSEISITGGTHVSWSPCFHFLKMHWLSFMHRIGYEAELELELAGFYPQGNGRVSALIKPARRLSPMRLRERGDLVRIRGLSAVSNLPLRIAERQRDQALQRLNGIDRPLAIDILRLPSRNKGTMLLLLAIFEKGQACYFSLGERGKLAERVADEAVDALQLFLATHGAIDEYLADQLLLPLTFASGDSDFSTSKITQHLLTNAEVIRAFLPMTIEIDGSLGHPGCVRIKPSG